VSTKTKATLAEIVDELGDLEVELKPLTPKLRRADQLKKEIRERYDAKAEDASFVAEGERFVVNIGARKMQTHVNVAKLYKSVKLSVFLKIVGVTLKSLADNCDQWIIDAVTAEQQTGYRPLEVTQRGQPT